MVREYWKFLRYLPLMILTGRECRKWRERLGVKQTRLAVDLGLSPTLLCRWEAGLYELKPEATLAIETYLQARLAEVKEMQFPSTASMVLQ